MDKETAPHSTNTLEQNTRKRTRNQNWEWDDIFTFISIVNKEGKNWLKVLNIMHSQHQITHITDHTKLATQAAERKSQREERNKTLQKSVEEEINSTTY